MQWVNLALFMVPWVLLLWGEYRKESAHVSYTPKRQRGRPRTISGGKRINIYLPIEQIEWLKETGNMSQTLQKLIEKAKETNNLRESPDPTKHY